MRLDARRRNAQYTRTHEAHAMSTPKEVGNKYFSEKRYEDAIAEYTRAILAINSASSSPSSPNNKELAVLCGNRAECFIRLGQYLDALKDCQRCIEADPSNVKVCYSSPPSAHLFILKR